MKNGENIRTENLEVIKCNQSESKKMHRFVYRYTSK